MTATLSPMTTSAQIGATKIMKTESEAVMADSIATASGRTSRPAGPGGGRLHRALGALGGAGGRFIPAVRIPVMPVAGAAGLPLRRFVAANVVGMAGWAALHVAVGHLAGRGLASADVATAAFQARETGRSAGGVGLALALGLHRLLRGLARP